MGTRCSSELLPKLTCLGFLTKKQPGQVTPPLFVSLDPRKDKTRTFGISWGPSWGQGSSSCLCVPSTQAAQPWPG